MNEQEIIDSFLADHGLPELPDYIKRYDQVMKVDSWEGNDYGELIAWVGLGGYTVGEDEVEIATESEYTAYINSKK